MMSRLTPLFAAALLLLGLASSPNGSLASVQPLYLDALVGCAAFSINEEEHLWVTAGHCTTQEGVTTYGIGAQDARAYVVKRDDRYDLAILKGGLPTKALRLSHRAPVAGDSTETRGFPIGTPQVVSFYGKVASPLFTFPGEGEAVMLLDSQALPGISGSPVFVRGDVVGVFNGIYRSSTVGQIGYAATWAVLRSFVGEAWEKS